MMRFLAVVVGIWLCAMVIWWVFSSAFRHADVDRLKSRLLGTSKAQKSKKGSGQAALIQVDQKSGSVAGRIVQRFQLQAKLQELLEQAGLKWTPTRLVNACLLSGAAGFFIAWLMLPTAVRQFAWLITLGSAAAPFVYV